MIEKLVVLSQLVATVALAEGEAAPAAGGVGGLSPLFPLLLMVVIFYFLIIRPQSKKAKTHTKFLTELKKGDMVITNGGMIGMVKTLSDKLITLEVDNNVCIKMLRNQVLQSANTLKEEDNKQKK